MESTRAPSGDAVIDRGGDVVDVIPTAASPARVSSLGASDLARSFVAARSGRRAGVPYRPHPPAVGAA